MSVDMAAPALETRALCKSFGALTVAEIGHPLEVCRGDFVELCRELIFRQSRDYASESEEALPKLVWLLLKRPFEGVHGKQE